MVKSRTKRIKRMASNLKNPPIATGHVEIMHLNRGFKSKLSIRGNHTKTVDAIKATRLTTSKVVKGFLGQMIVIPANYVIVRKHNG